MTNEEAIKIIDVARAEVEWEYPMEYATAFDNAIEALEKQIPKKPVNIKRKYGKMTICPSCNERVGYGTKPTHCECGQLLDWSDEE